MRLWSRFKEEIERAERLSGLSILSYSLRQKLDKQDDQMERTFIKLLNAVRKYEKEYNTAIMDEELNFETEQVIDEIYSDNIQTKRDDSDIGED